MARAPRTAPTPRMHRRLFFPMDGEYSAVPPPMPMRSSKRFLPALLFWALLTIPAAAQITGRGAPPPGPPGPVPRLSDGKPDLTGIWNGQRVIKQDGPYMLPWAEKLVAQRATNSYADDLEARCLPGGPPRAAPYHTSLFSTPKLVLILFEGNTHMYRQLFVDGSDHPKDLKPTWYGDSRAHWDGDTLVVD